ncbi:MAG: hypothetical protein K8M05_33285, partial [Deltaproteobacteria bacterium]|nr:hypothetical protein [Kofleriaceae bacterium]
MDDGARSAALSALHRRAADAYPLIAIAVDRVAAGIASRVSPDATAAAIDALHHDVVLAIAA